MASSYKKTTIKAFPQTAKKLTRDGLYWNNLQFPVTKKEHGAVTHIEFSPVTPHNYAVTSSVRIQVHSSEDHEVVKSLSRFREVAYCGSYRSDGKLIIAGGDEGILRLFDVAGKTLLRTFRGHKGPTHVSRFLADNYRLMSGSDDKTVRIWDVASQSELLQFSDNTDYVRCGVNSPASKDILVTGSYDHHVRLYDTRSEGNAVLSMNHGAPVESILIFPTGGVVVSAGGNHVKVWDVLAGGRLLTTCSHHHKAVTCLAFCSHHQRLVSGSLDRHVKIYDVGTYQAVHTLDYPSAILSLGIAPDDSLIAVGMADGLLSVQRRRDEEDIHKQKLREYREKKASFRYTLRAKAHVPQKEDEVINHQKKEKLAKYDKYLRRFEFSKALDAAMELRVRMRTPHVTISVLQELMRRDRLKVALAGRDTKSLVAILKFLQKNISNPRLMNTVIDTCNLVLDLYRDEFGQSSVVDEALNQLEISVTTEVAYMETCMEMMGMMEHILASAETKSTTAKPLFTGSGPRKDCGVDMNGLEQIPAVS